MTDNENLPSRIDLYNNKLSKIIMRKEIPFVKTTHVSHLHP